jgi:hypothetical protein
MFFPRMSLVKTSFTPVLALLYFSLSLPPAHAQEDNDPLSLYQLHAEKKSTVELGDRSVDIVFNEYIHRDYGLGEMRQGKLLIKPRNSAKEQTILYAIDESDGDSSSVGVNVGKHLIKGDRLIIYQYWAWFGDALVSPFGARKISYRWSNEENAYQKRADVIYLEYRGWHGTPSIEGLVLQNGVIKKPVTAQQKLDIDAYIDKIIVDGQTFALGKDAEKLLDETRAALSTEIERKTPLLVAVSKRLRL